VAFPQQALPKGNICSAKKPPQFEGFSMADGEPIRIDYVPRPGLGKITIANLLLGIVTLSIYRFWGKTNVRRHVWSCVHLNGQPLEYTGRGGELFKGALVVFGVLVLPYVILQGILQISLGPQHPAVITMQVLFALVILVFWGVAVYRARRYQLSRTLWRGIRGTMAGSPMAYSWRHFGGTLAKSLSLGWATPAINTMLQRRMIGEMRFGNAPFAFNGESRPLYGRYALCWLMSVVPLATLAGTVAGIARFGGIGGAGELPQLSIWHWALVLGLVAYFVLAPLIWSIYTAAELNTFASYTSFDGARFTMQATAWKIIKLVLGNLLIGIFTLGIAAPFVQQRLVRFLCDNIAVDGTVGIDRILQSRAPIDTRGEGLADAFDVGGI
jgi:uncharacterized membrane protein YjgN (DUF898 family)